MLPVCFFEQSAVISARESTRPTVERGHAYSRRFLIFWSLDPMSTIFPASSNALAGVEGGIVAASLRPSSSYIVTMKPP
jgi:hypothetical protein